MRLWIDDVRTMPKDYDVWAKTAEEAILALRTGKVTHASFDHDLGDETEKTGYDVAVWIERHAYLNKLKQFTYDVHSANPVGVERIKQALRMADQYWSHHKNKI